MKPLFLLLFTCFLCGHAFSQSFYATNINNVFQRITINGTNITTQNITGCPKFATSIALHNNVMYYVADKVLYQATLAGNTLSDCTMLGTVPNTNALTVDKNGLLYLTDDAKDLFKFDPGTKIMTKLGTMPYSSAGDMVFYKDNLYLASQNGIVKVDIVHPELSIIVISSPASILGLAEVSVTSTLNKVYALDSKNGTSQTDLIELDLDNNLMGPTIGTAPSFYYDAASVVEDGRYLNLTIDRITATADCPFTGKGTIKLISDNATSAYTYTLKNTQTGITTPPNSTGIFSSIDPGPYMANVSNGLETYAVPYTVAVFSFAKPIPTITTKKPSCLNTGEITVATDATNGIFDVIYNGIAYGSSHTFTNLTANTYTFYARNATGCIVDTYIVKLDQDVCVVNVYGANVTEECATPNKGHATVVSSPGTDVYTYTINDPTNPTGFTATNTTGDFSNLDAGFYNLKVTSKGGGIYQGSLTVPNFTFSNPGFVYDKADATCSVNGSVKFTLTTNSDRYTVTYNNVNYPFNHLFSFPEAGRYDFKLLKPDGCVLANVSVPIVKKDCEIVFFPNTFSPNGDGINDIFRPSQNVTANNFEFKIYNRLGSLMFTSASAQNGWDGQSNGKPVSVGVYYWIASYINNENLLKSQNGYITLVR